MPDPKTQAWDFGDVPFDDPTDLPRNDLLKKTRDATTSVGYVPHKESAEEPARRPRRKTREPLPKAPSKSRGRPRKSRSIPLSTKITPEHDALLKAIAADGLVIADIVAEALTVFARELADSRQYKRFPLDENTVTKALAVVNSSKD